MKNFVLIYMVSILCSAVAFAQVPGVPQTKLGIQDVAESINRNCVAYNILGACPITPLQATHLLVSWWEPKTFVETTPRTGESIFTGDFLGQFTDITAGLFDAATTSYGKITAGGGSSTSVIAGHSNLHFNEARVYTGPGLVSTICPGHGESGEFTFNYASDADPLWRLGQPNLSPVEVINDFGFSFLSGVWGRVFPRVGFLSHSSKHVAGAQASVRAAWIAHDPVGAQSLVFDNRIQSIITPSAVRPMCWQLAYPRPATGERNKCYPPGVHPAYWDRGLITLDSSMLHIFYELNIS